MIELFARHKVAANLTMIIMVLAGIWAIKSIPVQLDPPRKQNVVWVEVSWPGASAEDVEELITLPVENQVRNLPGLNEVTSRSINGYMQVLVRFHYNADMTNALDQVKQRVASIRNLPADIETPIIRREIDLQPVGLIQVTGTGDINELIPVVRRLEKDLLARGIELIEFNGLPTEEIAVQVSSQTLQELGLSLDDLTTQVSRLSRNVPAGAIGRGQGSRQLRSLDQRRDPLGFEQLDIESGDQLISLGSIAEIVRRPREGQPIVTNQGRPTIGMMLLRSSASDAYSAHKLMDSWLEETAQVLPEGVEVTLTGDIWVLVGAQIDLITKNGLTGLLLVILTLFIFLNGRVGLWVMVGIPVSFMLALAVLYGIFGFGLAMVCLIGFIMALGIVVDDAIVVAEDAATHFEAGDTPLQAAVKGAKRMWVPVVTSSLTTMAAFIPILIMGGEMGAAILALPTVLLCVIIASLIECFLVLPGHLRHSLAKVKRHTQTGFRARFDAGFIRFREEKFEPLVARAMDYPGATICAALGAAIIAFSLVASDRVSFSMNIGLSPEDITANFEFSASATETQKGAFIKQLEDTLAETDAISEKPNVLGWVTKRNTADFNEERQAGVQFGALELRYAFKENRTVPPQTFVNRWKDKISQPPYVEQLIVAVQGGLNNGRPDLSMVLSGNDIESLKAGAEELTLALSRYPGVTNLIDNLPYGAEQMIFELTPTGRSLGLTSSSLGRQLHAAYSGRRVQIFNQDENELEVRLMLPDSERDDLLSLQQFPIKTPAGNLVPLANVATFYNRRGIDVIRHTNSKMSITISARVDQETNTAMSVLSDIEETVLPEILSRHNLTFGLGGMSFEEQRLLSTMLLGAMLSLLLIYLILTWVFSSYIWPLAIMIAIPFGITGGIFGHWIMGINLSAMSLLALLSLSGIVVNDSIVLLSFLKRHIEEGEALVPALKKAVSSRFRAVILTSLTTIAGLLPLMFETSSMAVMVMTPIAVTICFGLFFATFLILLVIPAFVLLLEQAKLRIHQLINKSLGDAKASVQTISQGM